MFRSGPSNNPSNALSLWLTRFFKKYGENVKSHDFRTTHATNHYNAHKDLKLTSDLLGHKDIRVTDKYVKANETEVQQK